MGKTPVGTFYQVNNFTTAISIAAAIATAIPAGATSALLTVETQSIRYTYDSSVLPTTTRGHLVAAGGTLAVDTAGLQKIRIIQVTTTAVVNISFFKD